MLSESLNRQKNGASAVKIQTYMVDNLTLKSELPDFIISDGLCAGRTLYDLYEWAHKLWDWHDSLFKYARKIGITMFSSPFESTAVDMLQDLNAPAYKIASFEVIDLALKKYVANTGKPMIISTGMADCDKIGEAVEAAREGGCKELALLDCVSDYPSPSEDYNLITLQDIPSRFSLITRLSDHTLDNSTTIAAVALGALIVEKHFTVDRNGGGPDDSFSLEPADLLNLCRDSKTVWRALGKLNYARKPSEI